MHFTIYMYCTSKDVSSVLSERATVFKILLLLNIYTISKLIKKNMFLAFEMC